MTKKTRGLCSTCAHSVKCILKRAKDNIMGVQHCEEYETACLPAAVRSPEQPSERFKQAPSKILGLCSNCAQYPVCSFPKPESGVWHCEEYR
ncbi:MAG: hypothetical protein BWY90_01180 [Deltaproteobacteria bacterium ADurb.BinA014]|jgi:hypothetical protein|nr:MAG: hypothetical protein BWY90_01180 [Deltaproteobacteria bacterium ADurb.BinA014]